MKIIILAAGLGSRLRKGEGDIPKPLTVLRTGETIMQVQVKSLKAHFDVNDIMLVVGYKMNLIMECFPSLLYVYNEDFSSSNTSKSLLRALRKVKNEGTLWLNGDVVFDDNLLGMIKPCIEKDQSFVSVNNAKVSDEEIKYTLDSEGHIEKLSKTVIHGLGEAVGINYISSKDLEAFKMALDECDEKDYFERGLEILINRGHKIVPVDISKSFCMEIDFQEDLNAVNEKLNH